MLKVETQPHAKGGDTAIRLRWRHSHMLKVETQPHAVHVCLINVVTWKVL